MPRLTRLDAPGVIHHIIIRGTERRKSFRDNRDRENFLERLGNLLQETKTVGYAWVFLHNHAHFLLRTGEVLLATFMGRLLTGYVVSFNRLTSATDTCCKTDMNQSYAKKRPICRSWLAIST